jgi:hypothetical protein
MFRKVAGNENTKLIIIENDFSGQFGLQIWEKVDYCAFLLSSAKLIEDSPSIYVRKALQAGAAGCQSNERCLFALSP